MRLRTALKLVILLGLRKRLEVLVLKAPSGRGKHVAQSPIGQKDVRS